MLQARSIAHRQHIAMELDETAGIALLYESYRLAAYLYRMAARYALTPEGARMLRLKAASALMALGTPRGPQ